MPSHFNSKTSHWKMLIYYKNSNVGLNPKLGDKLNNHTYYSFHCYDNKGIGEKKLKQFYNSVSDKTLQMVMIDNRTGKAKYGVCEGSLMTEEQIEKYN